LFYDHVRAKLGLRMRTYIGTLAKASNSQLTESGFRIHTFTSCYLHG